MELVYASFYLMSHLLATLMLSMAPVLLIQEVKENNGYHLNSIFSWVTYHRYYRVLINFCCTVHFRFIVFRPFIGEILVGKIRSSSSEGLRGKMNNILVMIM